MITKEQTVFLLRIGFGIVFIQNGLLLASLWISAFVGPLIIVLDLCLDIIGFLTIAIGLFLFGQYEIPKKRIYYRLSGSFIAGWVIVTIFWRLLLIIEKYGDLSEDFSNILPILFSFILTMPMFLFLGLSATLLAIGIICLYYVRRDEFTQIFSIFGILNLIGAFVMFIMFQVASVLYISSNFSDLPIYDFEGIYAMIYIPSSSIKGVLVPLVAVLLGRFVFQKRIYEGWIGRDWEETSKERHSI
ncbi:MAG: hypothetical protein ACFFC7_23095 [Candidatus Hermodarchaeota archaeon]